MGWREFWARYAALARRTEERNRAAAREANRARGRQRMRGHA